MPRATAIVLLSGGLDSMLAARILQVHDVHVIGLHLYTGLCITEHKRRTGQRNAAGDTPQNPVFYVADALNIPLEILDISTTYLDVITKPKYGRGSGVNPCKDCRIHMFEHAFAFMQEAGANFIATGEVLGQRPMSQVKLNLKFIHRKTGIEDLILMPLSAKLMAPTKPEREGWVDRERLYDMHGRSRKPQLALAAALGITEYEQPAGGCCFLTDENYARKFKDLLAFDPDRRLDLEDVVLLGVGRHFRLSARTKVVVGRYHEENNVIERHAGGRMLLRPVGVEGPTAVAIGVPDDAETELMARLVARYSQGRDHDHVTIRRSIGAHSDTLQARPIDLTEVEALRI